MKSYIPALISLLFSATVGYLSFSFGYTDAFQSVILSLLTSIVTEMTLMLSSIHSVSTRNKADNERLANHIERIESMEDQQAIFFQMERDLADIKAASHGSRDIFVSHLQSELTALSKRLSDANKRKEISIRSDYIINVHGVFDSLDGSHERSVKITYPIEANSPWVGGASDRRFIEVLLDRVANGDVQTLKLLFLVDSGVDTQSSEFIRIIGFFNKKPRITAKFAKKTEFSNICRLNGVDPSFLDFGVYGDRMIFRTTTEGPEHEGIYCKEKSIIERYNRVFDQTWDSEAIAVKPAIPQSDPAVRFNELCELMPPNEPLRIGSV